MHPSQWKTWQFSKARKTGASIRPQVAQSNPKTPGISLFLKNEAGSTGRTLLVPGSPSIAASHQCPLFGA